MKQVLLSQFQLIRDQLTLLETAVNSEQFRITPTQAVTAQHRLAEIFHTLTVLYEDNDDLYARPE